jgi:hypothetical protein
MSPIAPGGPRLVDGRDEPPVRIPNFPYMVLRPAEGRMAARDWKTGEKRRNREQQGG